MSELDSEYLEIKVRKDSFLGKGLLSLKEYWGLSFESIVEEALKLPCFTCGEESIPEDVDPSSRGSDTEYVCPSCKYKETVGEDEEEDDEGEGDAEEEEDD